MKSFIDHTISVVLSVTAGAIIMYVLTHKAPVLQGAGIFPDGGCYIVEDGKKVSEHSKFCEVIGPGQILAESEQRKAQAHDAGTPDAGTPDAGTPDAGTPDAGTPDGGSHVPKKSR